MQKNIALILTLLTSVSALATQRKVVCSLDLSPHTGRSIVHTDITISANVGPAPNSEPNKSETLSSFFKIGNQDADVLVGGDIRLSNDSSINVIIINMFQGLSQDTPEYQIASTPRERDKLIGQIVTSFSENFGTTLTASIKPIRVNGELVEEAHVTCALWRQ